MVLQLLQTIGQDDTITSSIVILTYSIFWARNFTAWSLDHPLMFLMKVSGGVSIMGENTCANFQKKKTKKKKTLLVVDSVVETKKIGTLAGDSR